MRRLFVMFAMAFVLAVLVAMPPAVAAQKRRRSPRNRQPPRVRST